jgi:hypothetical protein
MGNTPRFRSERLKNHDLNNETMVIIFRLTPCKISAV